MSYNFCQLLQDAIEHEEIYATDDDINDDGGKCADNDDGRSSNKTKKTKNSQDKKILQNPIKKLEKYQQYYYNTFPRISFPPKVGDVVLLSSVFLHFEVRSRSQDFVVQIIGG